LESWNSIIGPDNKIEENTDEDFTDELIVIYGIQQLFLTKQMTERNYQKHILARIRQLFPENGL
jgi:hypothetical protein